VEWIVDFFSQLLADVSVNETGIVDIDGEEERGEGKLLFYVL